MNQMNNQMNSSMNNQTGNPMNNQTGNPMNNQMNNQMTNQTQAMPNQTGMQANTAPQAAAQGKNTQFSQLIQQVDELRQSLHNFIDQEDFPDARLMAASGTLEGHLSHYYQLAVEKENQKPGLESL